jgi:EAL domain-containing protein (putative c-di-GMP-specific phosphodiesterase class I)
MLFAGLLSLASGLGARCVAKGVETPEQWDVIHELGCDRVQGFLFGGPVPPDRVEALLRRERREWLAEVKEATHR